MSLEVWLPFNSTYYNYGLSEFSLQTSNAPQWDTGKLLPKALKFSGYCGYSTYTPKHKNNFSVACWIKWNENDGSVQTALSESRVDSTCTGWGLWLNDGGKQKWQFSNKRISAGTIEVGKWHHLCMTVDENMVVRTYQNGKLIATEQVTVAPTYAEDIGLGFACFRYKNGDGVASHLYLAKESISDFRLYNHCLSVREVKEISKGLIRHYKCSRGANALIPMSSIVGCENGTISYDKGTNTFTVTAAVTTSTWGSGIKIKNNSFSVAWGSWYIITAEVMCPSNHTLKLDYNNDLEGATGNDHDNTGHRLPHVIELNGGVWTPVIFGTVNNDENNNPNHLVIKPYDFFGLVTKDDTEPVVWYIRNIYVKAGKKKTRWMPSRTDPLYTALGYSKEPDCSGYDTKGEFEADIVSTADSEVSLSYDSSFLASGGEYIKFKDPITANTEEFTVSINVNFTSLTDYQCIWNGRSTSTCYAFSIFTNNSDLRIDDSIQTSVTAGLKTNVWYNITVTWKLGGKKRTYINGELKSEVDACNLTGKSNTYASIGQSSNADSMSGTNNLKARFNNVRVYATELSSEDIKQLYQRTLSICKSNNLLALEFEEE